MSDRIESLESEKSELETKNASYIEENRQLLDQLENINNAVTESDVHVTSLQATLLSTQQELQKLSHLARKTELLEKQLAEFEKEQATWQESLSQKEDDEKTAVRRWQQAERTLAGLQEQIDRIEREAKEERERHVEVVGRMQRRTEVEKELNSAAGRLKGAAAFKTNGRETGGTNVVSHFVKDILQDNANLQMGIVELRGMLVNSNEEVENLRTQLLEHQPMDESISQRPPLVAHRSLNDELSAAAAQELHVHHHYHAPSSAGKTATLRRPRKKRYGALTPGHFTPQSGASTPRTSVSGIAYGTPSSAATILSQTAVSVPQQLSSSKRWSSQSSQTYRSISASSGPSSPQSTSHRTSSVFDRVFSDDGHDSSRPTSPDSDGPGSPFFTPMTSKRGSGNSFRTYSAPQVTKSQGISPSNGRFSLNSILDASVEDLPQLDHTPSGQDPILEESEGEWENTSGPAQSSEVTSPMKDDLEPTIQEHDFYRQPLRRAASHESLLSVSGMDIHTLKTRPAQLLMGTSYGGRSFSSQPVVSETTAHAARPSATRQPSDRSKSLLSGMAADQRKQTLSRKASGWLFGKWGATPVPAVSSQVQATTKMRPSSADDSGPTPRKPKVRTPGINQAGPILGMVPEVRTQQAPILRALDEEALREGLGE